MVRKALKKIKNEYISTNATHQEEFKILEKRFKTKLEQSALNWIRNHYDCTKSSREVFNYLESKL